MHYKVISYLETQQTDTQMSNGRVKTENQLRAFNETKNLVEASKLFKNKYQVDRVLEFFFNVVANKITNNKPDPMEKTITYNFLKIQQQLRIVNEATNF